MSLQVSRYSAEETARRGDEIYEQQIRSLVEQDNWGKVVAIDIESGAYAVAENALSASHDLLDRLADAEIWCVRVGSRALHRIMLLPEELTPRPHGLAAGEFVVPDDFDEPLPDEIQRLFEGLHEPDTEVLGWEAKTPTVLRTDR